MTAFDEPSFDGNWNVDYSQSTWFSPEEIFTQRNTPADVYGNGWNFLYWNDIFDVVRTGSKSSLQ